MDEKRAAEQPHADKHTHLANVLRAHVAPGYCVSVPQGNPAIREWEEAAEHRGEARGKARGFAVSILEVLEARGVAVSLAQRDEILACLDIDRSKRRLRRAASAPSADEILAVP